MNIIVTIASGDTVWECQWPSV